MSWSKLRAVFSKEIVDHLRDRRSLLSALVGVAVGPLLIGFLLSDVARDRAEAQDITIPIAGRERAPELAEWLEQQDGVTLEEAPEDVEAAVRAGEPKLALLIDEEFRERFAAGKPAPVKFFFDSSDDSTRARANRTRNLLRGYNGQIGGLRLIARGVSPALLRPVRIDEVEVSSAQQRAVRILAFLPMLLLLAAFGAGMGAAADATAGERERGSLEALLVNPAPSRLIVFGKYLAAAAIAIGGAGLSLVLCTAVVHQIPLQELGVRLRLETWQLATSAGMMLPAALLAPAMQMLVCSFSRTLKEAQSYLGMLVMIPMLPLMLTMVLDIEDSPWINVFPFVSQSVQLTKVLGGTMPAAWEIAVSAAVTLALCAGCVWGMARLFGSEKIIFSR